MFEPSRATHESKYSPLPDLRLHCRSLAPCAGNEPMLCWFMSKPGTINLRSSAFICGSFFAEAPDSKDADRINRMDRINLSTNPVNPVHPVQSDSSFSAAPDINCSVSGALLEERPIGWRLAAEIRCLCELCVLCGEQISTAKNAKRAQSIHKLINKATEMTKMTEKAPDINRIKVIKQNYLNSALTSKPAR